MTEKSMWGSAVTAYIHYLGFMLAFAALTIEHLNLKKDLTLESAWRIVIADAIYGLSAAAVLITGVLRVLYFGKGTEYYLSNPVFHVKAGIFIFVGLLSLYPTFSFLTWVKALREGTAPSLELPKLQLLIRMIRVELVGFILIPLAAAMLARGIQFG